MSFPRWYKIMLPIWAVLASAFWWFATSFNGLPFFSLPQLASSLDGAGWQIGLAVQLILLAALVAPLSLLPLALKSQRKLQILKEEKKKNAKN